jgi:hypothetical protein
MRDPKKKCIAKKCEECNFYQSWDVAEFKDGVPTGVRKMIVRCSLQVLFDEVPRIKGSIDGCQQAANETRNNVLDFGEKSIKALRAVSQTALVLDSQIKKIEG